MKSNDFNYQPKNVEELIKMKKLNSRLKTDNLIRFILVLCACAVLTCLVVYAFTGREGLIEKALMVGGAFISSCFAYFAGKGAKEDD